MCVMILHKTNHFVITSNCTLLAHVHFFYSSRCIPSSIVFEGRKLLGHNAYYMYLKYEC